jgi:hypothetical protein
LTAFDIASRTDCAELSNALCEAKIKPRNAVNHRYLALQNKRARMLAWKRLMIDRRLSGATYRLAFYNASPVRCNGPACKQCNSRHPLTEGDIRSHQTL